MVDYTGYKIEERRAGVDRIKLGWVAAGVENRGQQSIYKTSVRKPATL